MTTVKVELSVETIDQIVVDNIREALEYVEWAKSQAESGRGYIAVFDYDQETELKELNKRIEAFKLVKEWFGG